MQVSLDVPFMDQRNRVSFAYTIGRVTPECDNLPKELSLPLEFYRQGTIEGFQSMRRSGLVNIDGSWFKYKGYKPSGKTYCSGEPYGCMSAKKARNELDVNGKLSGKCKEHGINFALRPVADVEYQIKFKNENVHAIIQECHGDTRMDTLQTKVDSRIYASEIDSCSLKALTEGVFSWMGFANGMLKENRIEPLEESVCLQNYALYDTGTGGFGIGRIDHGSSKYADDIFRIDKDSKSLCKQLNTFSMGAAVAEESEKIGPIGDVFKKLDMLLQPVSSLSKERVDREKSLIYIGKKRLEFLNEMEDKYYKFYDSIQVPKPIDKNLVSAIF